MDKEREREEERISDQRGSYCYGLCCLNLDNFVYIYLSEREDSSCLYLSHEEPQ